MKIKSLSFCRGNLAPGLVLVLLTANFSFGQNFVKNADFEEPLGSNPSNNWTVVYVSPSGPSDFLVAGRTTFASKDMVPGTWDGGVGGSTNKWSKFGGHFAPNHVNVVHAYFRQIVTGLQPGSNYSCSAWMVQFSRYSSPPANPNHFAKVYLAAIGATSNATQIVNDSSTNNAFNHAEYWQRYSVTNTANASGQIELQLHYDKTVTISYANNPWEYRNCNGFYDRVSVVPVGQAQHTPPYKIVAVNRNGQDLTLQWETVMNNRYRIQASTNIVDPAAWVWVERGPRLDTNFLATGTTLTFKTNVSSLFYYDPFSVGIRPEWRTQFYFDSNAPLFFRISSTPFPL